MFLLSILFLCLGFVNLNYVKAVGTVAGNIQEKIGNGALHSCVINSSNGVECWGYNYSGQVGNNTSGNYVLSPTAAYGMTSGVKAVSAGAYHTCALLDTGALKCWGSNNYGQIGDNSSGTNRVVPTQVYGLSSGVVAVAAGEGHTCALLSTGAVKCWGYNISGQIGDNTSGANRLSPTQVSGLTSGVKAITAGLRHTCALLESGAVECWGQNSSGEIGDNTSGTNRLVPTQVSGLTSGVVAITAGYSHTCALLDTGAVKCWGSDYYGQIGDNTSGTNRLIPTQVTDLSSGVSAISAGYYHTCAVISSGAVNCWGYNEHDEVGNDMIGIKLLVPTQVNGLTSGVIAVSAGYYHNCVILSDGAVKCWGYNNRGQIGDGTSGDDQLIPVDVTGLTGGIIGIAAGSSHNCVLLDTGGVKCWGTNSDGQLGNNSTTGAGAPINITDYTGSGTVSVRAGSAHSCILTDAGAVKCWGDNTYGQLGDNTSGTDRLFATQVYGTTSGVVKIMTGSFHSCAIYDTGGVKCWGYNNNGQIGDNSTSNRLVPTQVSGLTSGVIEIAGGVYHTCALLNTGAVECWGDNLYGQLGDNTTTDKLVPTQVNGLTEGVTAIAADGYSTCALLNTGGVKCWGQNSSGQVGDGTSGTNRLVPTQVSGLTSGVAAIDNGGADTCALLNTGAVECWGQNTDGQLGDNTIVNKLVPTQVYGLTSGVEAIYNGGFHTCALLNTGAVKCWGNNSQMEVGNQVRFLTQTTTAGVAYIPNSAPSAPSQLYANNDTAQSGKASPAYKISDPTPAFSAIFSDPNSADSASAYRIQVASDSGFSTLLWDSGKTTSTCSNSTRCADITYAGSQLEAGTTYYWQIKFWDNSDTEGVWSGTGIFRTNYAPQLSNILINSGDNIDLVSGATKSLVITATATDADGYNDIIGYSGKFYRSGVDNGNNCTADPLNCYDIPASDCSLQNCSGSSCTLSCSLDLQYFADATDTGTYAGQHWTAYIQAVDAQEATCSGNDAGTTEVNSILAFTLDKTSINFGYVGKGSNTGSVDQEITLSNTGNTKLDFEISGSNLCLDYPTCSASYDQIEPSYTKYYLSSFNYNSEGTLLSNTATRLEANLVKTSSTGFNSDVITYWGIGTPSDLDVEATFSGEINLNALISD